MEKIKIAEVGMAVQLLESCEDEIRDLFIHKIESDKSLSIERNQLYCNGILMDYQDFIVVTQIKKQITDIIIKYNVVFNEKCKNIACFYNFGFGFDSLKTLKINTMNLLIDVLNIKE